MRQKLALFCVFFMLAALSVRAQVYEMLYQGFEDGETVRCEWTPPVGANYSMTVYKGGSRSLHLLQQNNNEVILYLDSMDFTQNTTLRYISLQFDHICHVSQNSPGDLSMGTIEYRRRTQTGWTAWTPVTSNEYNTTGEYSSQFIRVGAFNNRAYPEWYGTTVTADMWKSERFDLDNVLSGLEQNERKVQIRFILRRRTLSGAADTNNVGWWLDNIKVSASKDRMVTPTISMVTYPDGFFMPSSRGARIELNATTSLPAGINPDSVYLFYKAGSDTTVYRLPMPAVSGVANRYACRIPFYGFDTVMQFYCVARDATSNANRVTFPKSDNTWVSYACIRGVGQPGIVTPGFISNDHYNNFPFPATADHRSEYVYDSALLRNAGYGPGAMTSLQYTLAASTQPQTQQRFQIKMLNVETDYTANTAAAEPPFYTDYMHVVYDSTYGIGALSSGTVQTIQFQDTFYYAGKDILMQITFDGTADHPGADIKMIGTTLNKSTIYYYGANASLNINPFLGQLDHANYSIQKRPAFIFYQHANPPLLYDAGISELVYPTFESPMVNNPDMLKVKLKNFGSKAFQNIRISYQIIHLSDTIRGYYDWTGNLNGSNTLEAGAEVEVIIADTISIPEGYCNLKVWVEDTLTSAGQRYRDHEPLNDTMSTDFIICEGHMGGVRYIGGPMAHYNKIDELLLALTRCDGLEDSLIVRLAPGEYPPFAMPTVNGLSAQHYIVFESMDPEHPATLYADSTTNATSIINLELVNNVRLRNLNLVRRQGGAITDMVTLAENSGNCRIEGCSFIDSMANPSADMRISSLINSVYANNLTVDGCTFVGGRVGVDIKGQASNIRSVGNVVRNSLFRNQNEVALRVENQSDIVVEDNKLYDVTSYARYVLQMSECYGTTSVQRNRVYTSHGAGAMGLSSLIGTAEQHVLVANNMVVCEDDGNANQMSSPFSIMRGAYMDVVYNSVKMAAPMRSNVAAATFGGSGVLDNSRFMNNIVVSLNATNYAFSYQPLNSTTNIVQHNDYYSVGAVLNKKGSAAYASLADWQVAMPDDSLSISVNPNFLNGELVDLRSFNRQIKGVAVPIEGVSTDIYGTLRDTLAPCIGAFEFLSLDYDFEPEAMLSPLAEDCYMPEPVEMVLRMRNSGVRVYNAGGEDSLQVFYHINGGAVDSVTVIQSIPAEDTVTVYTGVMLRLPANGVEDSTYVIRIWTSYPTDPNQTNDTNTFTVISRYHPAAPGDDTVSVPYATSAVIHPTKGVDMWSVYNSSEAPLRQSQIYWYADSTDTEPFYVGHSYTTGELSMDEEYYIRQRRAMPIVRITQLEIKRGSGTIGGSPNVYWMSSGRKVALQLTNIGDAPANLAGDTLRALVATTSGSGSATVTNYVFGDVTIAPGASLVVQTATGTSVNPEITILTGTPMSNVTVNYNTHCAFIYKRNGVVEDAVAINNVTTAAPTKPGNWSQQNVPSYVWNSAGVPITTADKNTAGLIRTAFNGDSTDWAIATADNPMFLDDTKGEWIRYVDRGCEGEMATITAMVLDRPAIDLSMGRPSLSAEGCGLSEEEVTVTVANYGTASVSSFQVNYSAGGTPVSEMVTGLDIASGDSVTYTFDTPLNLMFPNDTMVTVRVWVTADPADNRQVNDTNQSEVLSLFTPIAPDAISTRYVSYAHADTIEITSPENTVPVWYDYDFNPVDTGNVSYSEILYVSGTRGVQYMAVYDQQNIVGTGTSVPTKTAFPQPYQPNNAYSKQQYIYSASELSAAGLSAGKIYSVSFFLDSIYNQNATTPRDSIEFSNYVISMGLISDTIFSAKNAWKSTSVVYQRQPMVIYRSQSKGWIDHVLDTPFSWDGTSSIVVQIYDALPAAITSGVQSRYTSKSNTTLYKAQNDVLATDFSGNGTLNDKRPNIQFGSKRYGCPSTITPYEVQMTDVPSVDASLFWLAGDESTVYNDCDSIVPMVRVRNQGSTSISEVRFLYYLDTMGVDSTIVTTTLASGEADTIPLFGRQLTPGRHSLTVVAAVEGDDVHSNDTLRRSFIVRFCGGEYTISSSNDNADYQSFLAPMDTLNAVGIDNAVTFLVEPGIYVEQVTIGDIYGSSSAHDITIRGTNTGVVLRGNTTQTSNYVLKVEGTTNLRIDNIAVESRPTTGNFGHAVVVQGATDLRITNCCFRVKGSIAAATASCLVLGDTIDGLTLHDNVIDSGYYSICATDAAGSNNHLRIYENKFNNFASYGIYLRNAANVSVNSNEINSGNSSDSRGLIGVYLANLTDSLSVQKNKIYLLDGTKGAKRGIVLEKAVCSVLNQGYVANNMISTNGTNSSGLFKINNQTASAGIVVDTMSSYLNIIYNSVRVYGTTSTTSSNLTYGFYCSNSPNNLMVYNNIFSNFSYGYAYYVGAASAMATSNFNAYYSQAAKPFNWNGTDRASLAAMQNANNDDANSLFDEPPFASANDLHLRLGKFSDKAQYSTDVTEDIDGNIRSQIPSPTIGAHETERLTHDMVVYRIYKPVMPKNLNNPLHIESDSVLVSAAFYNNGRSSESNVTWYAYIIGHEESTRSVTRSLGTLAMDQMKQDSVMIPTIMGLIDTQFVRVVVVDPLDDTLTNNQDSAQLYLAPAYNLKAFSVDVINTITQNTSINANCYRQKSQVKLVIKNDGFKVFSAGQQIKVGYHAEISSPVGLTIANIPDTVEQMYTVENDLLPKSQGTGATILFDSLANLYPTGHKPTIKVKVNAWCSYPYDIVPSNDTTDKKEYQSNYTPKAPEGHDTILPYGSWGDVTAEQEDTLTILWCYDTTLSNSIFYPASNKRANNVNNYNASTVWPYTESHAPDHYYRDTVYYLKCVSKQNSCPSYFDSVKVRVADPIENDIAVEEVLAPLGKRVYLENDTVRVRVANYGILPQSNIPITCEVKKGNAIVDTITEVISTTIPAGQSIVYTFDTLLPLAVYTPDLNKKQSYSLRLWTDLPGDQTPRNDTLRKPYSFNSLLDSISVKHSKSSSPTFDITRVSFNQIDVDIPPLGRGYTDLATPYNAPDYPVCHLSPGSGDSLIIQVTPLDATEQPDRCKVWAFIDFDRSGTFSASEYLITGDVFYNNTIYSSYISVPQTACHGYMRMRIVVGAYGDFVGSSVPAYGIPSDKDGHVMDFLVFIDETVPETDLAISQIVTPRNGLVRDGTPFNISFRMLNKGSLPVSSTELYYSYTVGGTATVDSFQWTGNLAPGTSTVVSLPDPHVFQIGTTTLNIWHRTAGDTKTGNDTLEYEYHRFHVITLVLDDDFEGEDLWYAPRGYNVYSQNFWQRGTPQKSRSNYSISSAYSGDNVWVTELNNNISTGTRGNVSYLYSPVINIAQIRADTLFFRLRSDLYNGSLLRIEYYNTDGKWVNMSDTLRSEWYNKEDDQHQYIAFTGTMSNAAGYKLCYIRDQERLGDFAEKLQFRFVFTTPMDNKATYGMGCAIDDFHINRALIKTDAGVTAITQPTDPKYGQTIYPEAVVHNYGYDTIRRIRIGYTYYGTCLATEQMLSLNLGPGDDTTILFDAPFVITSDFPERFEISAFTIHSSDNYRDNDTTTKEFFLSPLSNDISAEEIISPRQYVIAGDTAVELTLRVRNFGANPIKTATLSYTVNGMNRVDEVVDFTTEPGRDSIGALQSMEYYNYPFRTKFNATMGLMRLTAIAKTDSNEYIYNDTVYKRVEGITSVNDMASVAVVEDTSDHNLVRISMIIENRGARGANNFEIGYWIHNDTSTMVRETYSRVRPIPSLTTGYYLFETTLPPLPSGMHYNPRGYVHIENDNDPSNDTTDVLVKKFYPDIEVVRLLVEENASSQCRVFMELRNVGNLALVDKQLRLRATINDSALSYNVRRRIDAGESVLIEFNKTIPKSPVRRYEGEGRVLEIPGDTNNFNNQTSTVEVVNYVEGIPTVNAGRLVLEQNYPNPFTHQTTIPFSLPEAAQVRFFIMDAMGHIVHRLDRFCQAGDHTLTVDMDSYSAGIYFYGIEVKGQRQMRKMILK